MGENPLYCRNYRRFRAISYISCLPVSGLPGLIGVFVVYRTEGNQPIAINLKHIPVIRISRTNR